MGIFKEFIVASQWWTLEKPDGGKSTNIDVIINGTLILRGRTPYHATGDYFGSLTTSATEIWTRFFFDTSVDLFIDFFDTYNYFAIARIHYHWKHFQIIFLLHLLYNQH